MLSDPDIIYSVSIQCQSINTVITAKYFPIQTTGPTVDLLYHYSKKIAMLQIYEAYIQLHFNF